MGMHFGKLACHGISDPTRNSLRTLRTSSLISLLSIAKKKSEANPILPNFRINLPFYLKVWRFFGITNVSYVLRASLYVFDFFHIVFSKHGWACFISRSLLFSSAISTYMLLFLFFSVFTLRENIIFEVLTSAPGSSFRLSSFPSVLSFNPFISILRVFLPKDPSCLMIFEKGWNFGDSSLEETWQEEHCPLLMKLE